MTAIKANIDQISTVLKALIVKDTELPPESEELKKLLGIVDAGISLLSIFLHNQQTIADSLTIMAHPVVAVGGELGLGAEVDPTGVTWLKTE